MHENLLLILGLLFIVMLLVMLAQKIRIAYPILLVLAVTKKRQPHRVAFFVSIV
ncbi:hypothetical protein KK062_06355 [Fulvivirgaceae bacterium PWU5]|uniref:Uncharacterized protein n=1 Tax=Dawidia cretensis TaxID=2782350 RepID=A0AAP2GUQ5_9BACT|nr:hypothetical protein [Dawidia cretensis]MBT1707832.1 hypothetical protein [Dawidia cretensis]